MQRFFVSAVLATSLFAAGGTASHAAGRQNFASTQAPASGATTQGLVLATGTPVYLTFAQDIDSKTAFPGDPVVFLLDSDLKVNGVVVAKAASTAYAEVTKAEKSTKMGRPGQLTIKLDYLQVGKNKVKLRGTQQAEGPNDDQVPLTEKFGPLGIIKKSNIDIKQGTSLTVYVAEPITLPRAR